MEMGLFYAILSSLFLSTGFVMAKHFVQYTSPETLNVLWFSIAFAASFGWLMVTERAKTLKIFRTNWKDGVIVGGTNAIAAGLWFQSILINGPTTTAFLVRLSTIFIILLGVLFLKEKLHLHDVLGLAVALSGAAIISYSGGNYLSHGVVLAIVASFAIAVHQVMSKVYVKTINPLTLVSLRTFFTALFLLAYAVAFSRLQPVPVGQLPWIILGTIVNAVFGFIFFYKALELSDVSQVAIIRTLDPFVVVVYVLLVFQAVPAGKELLGGSLVVAGILVTVYGHSLRRLIGIVKARPWFG